MSARLPLTRCATGPGPALDAPLRLPGLSGGCVTWDAESGWLHWPTARPWDLVYSALPALGAWVWWCPRRRGQCYDHIVDPAVLALLRPLLRGGADAILWEVAP